MTNSERHIPWNDVGTEHARGLVATSDKLSRKMKEALAGIGGPNIPDFEDRGWKYEFCIFTMFWMWYVANSPKFTNVGATKPLLDAYHRGCYQAMLQATLIDNSEEALPQWEDDLEARFLAYKDAYDAELVEKKDSSERSLGVTGRGSVGWLFAHHLFPGQQPDVRLVLLLNEFGRSRFTGLVEMFNRLEAHYYHAKPWWKFWK
jgi:hypothetical protein